MALSFPRLCLKKVHDLDWMTPACFDVADAILQSHQISQNIFEQSRVRMAAASKHHKRTVQKCTRLMAEHGMIDILETRIAPSFNAINQYMIKERFFRQWQQSLSAAYQREILHKRAVHKRAGGQTSHPKISGGEKISKDLLPTPAPEEKSEEIPTREPGGLSALLPHGYSREQAQQFLEWLGCQPTSEHHEAALAGVMYKAEEESPGH